MNLSCSASGTPHPIVSWLKVDSRVRFNRSELVFTNINRNEAGQYRCEASNECGNASETATIEVQCKYQLTVSGCIDCNQLSEGRFSLTKLSILAIKFVGRASSDKNRNEKWSNSAYSTLEKGSNHDIWTYLGKACFRNLIVSLNRAREWN